MPPIDCQRCGACCLNPEENRRKGFTAYVSVTPKDEKFWRCPQLLDRYSEKGSDGETHMKLLGEEQRCAALRGVVRKWVRCSIYAMRPRVCRRLKPGGKDCLAFRREHGLDDG